MIETLIRRRVAFNGKAIDLAVDTVRLPNGKPATREFLLHPGAAAVLAFLDPRTVVLVRQYRHPVGEITYEIPAGKLSAGERPLACLRRELKEETGYSARTIRPLMDYWPTPAFSNEVIHIFWAAGLTPGRMRPDDDEFIAAEAVPFKRLLGWIRDGKIKDSKTALAALAYARFRRSRQ